jgi:transcription elongation factor Elf1
MEIKKWLKSSFSENNIPDWTCPSCNKGLLKIEKDQFHFEETQLSASWHSEEGWEPEYIKYRFNGTLKCKNCNDFISFMGRGNLDHVHYYNDFQDEYFEDLNRVFYPLYFNPPLNLFQITKKCPKEIKNEIEDSFRLFWNDLPSCANKIRTSLEMLMNQQNIKKTFMQGGKRKKLTLHKRIEEFKRVKPEIADFLLAIKWIGNTGSHIGILEKIDILDAYELLGHSLNKVFDDKETELKKKTKEIIKRKGTIKR